MQKVEHQKLLPMKEVRTVENTFFINDFTIIRKKEFKNYKNERRLSWNREVNLLPKSS